MGKNDDDCAKKRTMRGFYRDCRMARGGICQFLN